MQTAVGVYDSHQKAVDAVAELKKAKFPVKHLSILGKVDTEVVADNEAHILPKDVVKLEGIEAGTALGVALGVLTGVGIFAIPRLWFPVWRWCLGRRYSRFRLWAYWWRTGIGIRDLWGQR